MPGIMARGKHQAPAPPPQKERGNLWRRLSHGERVLSIIGLLTLVAASLVVPEVREFVGLEKEHNQQAEKEEKREPTSPIVRT